MASHRIPVFWGNGGSILEADLICYRELLATNRKWKMLASVAGTELPLVSIQRFRERLEEAGGNAMQVMANPNKERQSQHWEIQR